METYYVRSENPQKIVMHPGAESHLLFDEENSPVPGFSAMINEFTNHEFLNPGVHDDSEGFFVLEGKGSMRIGDEEFLLTKHTAMIVPAKTPHAIKKTGEEPLKIFLYHF